MTLAELRKHVGDKKLILGKDRVMKLLRKGDLKEVFLAVNCSLSDIVWLILLKQEIAPCIFNSSSSLMSISHLLMKIGIDTKIVSRFKRFI